MGNEGSVSQMCGPNRGAVVHSLLEVVKLTLSWFVARTS